ncbi:MAG: helix-hairpin-helix domain-containing protein [Gemmatimonadota bacterium]|nr:helix-hairpin-helix domain-containing protein [Gemmatimonadota bacterium]
MTIPRRALTLAIPVLALGLAACAGGDSEPVETAEAETPSATEPTAEAPSGPEWGDGLVNPNLAGEEEISGLEGIADGAVAAIMDGRPFMDMVTLDAAIAPHMDAAARESLYGAMWIPMNLNTASEEEMLLIPGVGDRMAHEFDEYRPYDGMGRFRREIGKYVDDDVVDTYARYVFIPIDLNTATAEQILMIPGVGSRMLHEFEEYRPYASMEQFMREIGKYVDDGELARLARYVTLAAS